MISSIAAYQAAKEAERKRREEEARKRAEDLMRKKQLLAKGGIDTYQMNTKEIDKLYKENERSIRQKVQEEKALAEWAKAKEDAKREAYLAWEKQYLEITWAVELAKRREQQRLKEEAEKAKAEEAERIINEQQLGLANAGVVDPETQEFMEEWEEEQNEQNFDGNEEENIDVVNQYKREIAN